MNLSIFGIIVVDTWLIYSQCTGDEDRQGEFYIKLAEELIGNNCCDRGRGQEGQDSPEMDQVDEDSPLFCKEEEHTMQVFV